MKKLTAQLKELGITAAPEHIKAAYKKESRMNGINSGSLYHIATILRVNNLIKKEKVLIPAKNEDLYATQQTFFISLKEENLCPTMKRS